MRIEVVIPTLDEAVHISALVERLLRGGSSERDRVDSVVVADGGSIDGTRELAERSGVRVLTAPRGRGSQLAAGAHASAADLLVFLHADCKPHAKAIERVRDAFADPQLVLAGFEQRIDAQGWFFRAVERSANRRVERGMVYGDSGLVVRRELYERVGGFRPLPLFEDVDLSRRLRPLARARLLRGALLEISARRWRSEGALRATLRNRMLRLAFAAGASPEFLARFYPPQRARDSK